MSTKLTTKQFIERAISIHGTKYSYNRTNYIGRGNKVIITCPIHGDFLQRPMGHVSQKQGCPICGKLNSNKNRSLTKSDFITRAIKLHGHKYDYTKTNYINTKTKIIITCPIHQDFLQFPFNHLQREGCPKCAHQNHLSHIPKSTHEFIMEARKKHKFKYDYSLVEYKQAHSKITIICPLHGKFYQTPRHHLDGNACPKCVKRISFRETQFLNYAHIPNTKENRQVKISRNQVDGIDLNTNTIYEFLGDYWHGNPMRYNPNEFNKTCHKHHGELYHNTMRRFDELKRLGYNVKYIWENDWKKFEHGIDKIPTILEY